MYKMKLNTEEYGTIEFSYFSIDKKRTEFPPCDINGKEVKKITEQEAKTHFETTEGEPVQKEQVYRLINGKPASKLTKTKEVKKYSITEKTEAHDLLKEHYYQMITNSQSAQRLKEYLAQNDKALKFVFSSGNGYKSYQAYLIEYKGLFVMMLGYGYLNEQIQADAVIINKETKDKQLELIEQAEAEALL